VWNEEKKDKKVYQNGLKY